jgi:hypothetical protein
MNAPFAADEGPPTLRFSAEVKWIEGLTKSLVLPSEMTSMRLSVSVSVPVPKIPYSGLPRTPVAV